MVLPSSENSICNLADENSKFVLEIASKGKACCPVPCAINVLFSIKKVLPRGLSVEVYPLV